MNHYLTPGQLIDRRYQIIATLQEDELKGSYLAVDTKLPQKPQCFLKIISARESQNLLRQEAEILATLGKHPQIPALMAYSEDEGECYLAREYISGTNLAEELQGKRLGESVVIDILTDLLIVLEYIHSQGLIYRDLQPKHVIRRQEDGKLVLIHFQAMIGGGLIGVNRGYIPSEQMRGEAQFSSDIYAVGIIGIQGLTGVHPVEGLAVGERGEILWQDLAMVGDGLARVLNRMTSYDWRDRYSTAQSAINALHRQENYTPNQSLSLSPAPETLSPAPKKWLTLSIMVLGVASTILIVLFIKWLISL
ncbi:MAG: protein kinase [Prochloron sp. SP5CPC1]|nr:protein kinase [Candidatus Paraprochloron terpiosi SP5CPC1]